MGDPLRVDPGARHPVPVDSDRRRYVINCPDPDYLFESKNKKRPTMGR
ncbi:hypothetical protein HT746_23985 [Burkholderia pyrrocinia]|nr:hypothetical protein [Burkholderia pyrrocinia]NTX30143.1 hypothetical protein [Burkholderia pyrrocinia]QVN21973.1 hypothetical protein JYG32_21600 [Burkholderia pyrrocinia]